MNNKKRATTMQTELEQWIAVSKVTESTVIVGEKSQCFGDLVEPMIPERLVRALLAGKVLCKKEPAMYVYRINGVYDGISNTLPPDDAYDEGTLQPLYSPAVATGIRLAHPFDEDVERAAFERWSKDSFIHFTDVSGVYELADTRNAWAAWLARARLADIGKEGWV
jgi:hypothetical protein